MKRKGAIVFYFLFILLVCLKSYRSPQYNWDILPYMGIILEYDGKNEADLHTAVYAAARAEIPAIKYQLLTDSNHVYRTKMQHSPEEFTANFPYYTVKPAYNYGNYLFYSAGIPLAKSTVLFSILGYMATGILVVVWLRKHLGILLAVLFSILIMLMPFMMHAASLSTPDAISAFFVLSAFYFLLQKDNILAATVFLLISILFRLDNILPFLAIQTGAYLYRRKLKVHALRFFLLAIASGLVIYFLVCLQVRSENWDRIYVTSFIEKLSSSYDQTNGFSWKEYLKIALSQLNTAVFHSYLAWFVLVASLLLVLKNTNGQTKLFVLLLFLMMFVRFILHPVVADRFYLPYYLVSLLLLITAVAPYIGLNSKKAVIGKITS